MSLLQLIKDDALQARKDRDKLKSSVLILVIGESERIAKDATDELVISVIKKMIKNLDVVSEKSEIFKVQSDEEKKILLPYVPVEQALTMEEAISKLVSDNPTVQAISLMGQVMKLGKGAYDRNQVIARLQQIDTIGVL